MIEPKQLKVGLLIWWTAERDASSWDCPGVITEVDEASNRFRVKTFDTMAETGGLPIIRPVGYISSLEEMEITTKNKVLDYISERETSLNVTTTELQQKIDRLKREASEYSEKANILRQELKTEVRIRIMPN